MERGRTQDLNATLYTKSVTSVEGGRLKNPLRVCNRPVVSVMGKPAEKCAFATHGTAAPPGHNSAPNECAFTVSFNVF